MNVLIVTSAKAGDGKSTVAAALALHLLASGRATHLLRLHAGDAASAERDASLLAAVPGVRSPGRALPLSEATATVKEAAGDGVAIVEATPAGAQEAASAWDAGIVVVQRAGPAEEPATSGAAHAGGGIAVTAVPAADISKVRASLEAQGLHPVLVLPEDRTLAAPRLGEVAKALEASFICDGADEDEVVERVMIGAVGHDPGPPYFSRHERKAVLTRFEKTDVQLAALGTPLVCLMLTGGQRPSPYLFDRAQGIGVPVLLTARSTPGAMEALGDLFAEVRFGGQRKIERLRELVAEHLDIAALKTVLP